MVKAETLAAPLQKGVGSDLAASQPRFESPEVDTSTIQDRLNGFFREYDEFKQSLINPSPTPSIRPFAPGNIMPAITLLLRGIRRTAKGSAAFPQILQGIHEELSEQLSSGVLDIYSRYFGDFEWNRQMLDIVYEDLKERFPLAVSNLPVDSHEFLGDLQGYSRHLFKMLQDTDVLSPGGVEHSVYLGDDGLFWEQGHRFFYQGEEKPYQRYYMNRAAMFSQEEFDAFQEASREDPTLNEEMWSSGIVVTVMIRIIARAIKDSTDDASFHEYVWRLFQQEIEKPVIQNELLEVFQKLIERTNNPWKEFYRKQVDVLRAEDRNIFKEVVERIGTNFVTKALDKIPNGETAVIKDVNYWGTQHLLLKNSVRYLTGKDSVRIRMVVREEDGAYQGRNYGFLAYRKAGSIGYLETNRPVVYDPLRSEGPGRPYLKVGTDEEQIRGLLLLFMIQAEAQRRGIPDSFFRSA